jgi:hypothetical protein
VGEETSLPPTNLQIFCGASRFTLRYCSAYEHPSVAVTAIFRKPFIYACKSCFTMPTQQIEWDWDQAVACRLHMYERTLATLQITTGICMSAVASARGPQYCGHLTLIQTSPRLWIASPLTPKTPQHTIDILNVCCTSWHVMHAHCMLYVLARKVRTYCVLNILKIVLSIAQHPSYLLYAGNGFLNVTTSEHSLLPMESFQLLNHS